MTLSNKIVSTDTELIYYGDWISVTDIEQTIKEILRINSTAHSRHQKEVLIKREIGDVILVLNEGTDE